MIIKEVAERLRDVSYITAEKKARRMLADLGINELLNCNSSTELLFTFTIRMYAEDIQQIVARQRRNNGLLRD